MKKLLLILVTLVTAGLAQAQWQVPLDSLEVPPIATATGVKYWFDNDIAGAQTIGMPSGLHATATVSAAALPSGLHQLHVQPYDSDGRLYPPTSTMFVSMIYMSSDSTELVCFFDNNPATSRTVPVVNGHATLNVADLPSGLHSITCQYRKGDASTVTYSSLFYSTVYTQSGTTLEYWFDNFPTHYTAPLSASFATVDASSLKQGLHTLYYRTVQGDFATPVQSTLFDRVDNDIVTLYYSFDSSSTFQSLPYSASAAQLDASALEEGDHVLNLMAQGSNGTYTPIDADTFYRYVCATSSLTTEEVTACDSFAWYGTTYTASTFSPSHTVLNADGCDSTILLHLTINYSTHEVVTQTAEGSFEWQGQTYTQSGEYTVYYETADGCDSIITLVLTIEGGESITVAAADGILLCPNPTTGRLAISGSDVLRVEVYNSATQRVATFDRTGQIDLTSLPAGLYLLRITTPAGTSVQRIIKQ